MSYEIDALLLSADTQQRKTIHFAASKGEQAHMEKWRQFEEHHTLGCHRLFVAELSAVDDVDILLGHSPAQEVVVVEKLRKILSALPTGNQAPPDYTLN